VTNRIRARRARHGMSQRARLSASLVGALCALAVIAALPAASAMAASAAAASAALPAASAAALPAASTAAPAGLQATPRSAPAPSSPAPIAIGIGELAKLELGALDIPSETLAELMSGIPGPGGSPTEVTPALESLLADPNTTLGELLEAIEGASAGEATPASVLQALTEGATTPEALAHLLSGLSGSLGGEQLAGLEQILQKLIGSLSPAQLESLEEVLGRTGSGSELAQDLVAQLTGSGSTAALEALLGDIGTLLDTTGSGLAEATGTPLEALAGDLGVSAKSLTESTGVSSILPSREIFYLLTGEEGLLAGVTAPTGTTPPTGGSTAPPAATATSTASTAAPSAAATSKQKSGVKKRVRIVRHRVHGHLLTLVVETPSAGTLVVAGRHVKPVHRRAGEAERLTLEVPLTRAGAASLRRRHDHHRRLTVRVRAVFKPKHGARSAATTKARFR
jgi:hypothetical protein